jgi:low affinity Fe/Cu permease
VARPSVDREPAPATAGKEHVVTDHLFTGFARWAAHQSGRALTFAIAAALIVIWAVSGFYFGFSDTWQLVINTATTIVTFLMVFLIQHTQNRDTQAIQLKLDELIRVNRAARNNLINLEEMSEQELAGVKAAFTRLAEERERGGKASESRVAAASQNKR